MLVVESPRPQYGFSMAEPPAENDDLDLMRRVQAGDTGAFTELVERHQSRVIGTITRMLGGFEGAEDLAQVVFVRVWRNAARWEPSAKFTTWLLTITRNLVFNEARRRGRARTVPLEDDEEGRPPREFADDSISTPAETMATAELQAAIDAAIQSLSEQPRMALVLRRYEDMPYEDIAVVLGVTVPAVKSMLFRARTELRSRLSAYLEESP